MQSCRKIIISRTDNLGDVVLTLPVAGILKSSIKNCIIYFIGKNYTKSIIEASACVDHFLDREEIMYNPNLLKEIKADAIIHVFPDKSIARVASKAGIPLNIGTSHRWFHWIYCNKRINFSRKNSDLHEAQLNLKLLTPLGINEKISTDKIWEYYGFCNIKPLAENLASSLVKDKFNIIIHPKSKGSAREWPLASYFALAKTLDAERFNVFVTGTQAEGEIIKREKPDLLSLPHVTDLTGKLSLEELIAFINGADGLVACSTGPLHIGASLGKNVCGIYPPMKPIHPQRWAPLGKNASYLVLERSCSDCKKNMNCHCIQSISAGEVFNIVNTWKK